MKKCQVTSVGIFLTHTVFAPLQPLYNYRSITPRRPVKLSV